MATQRDVRYDEDKLFFVILEKGHEDLFKDPLVDDYWLFQEDIMPGNDFYYVVMKNLDAATRKLIVKWRKLPYVDSVEHNQL